MDDLELVLEQVSRLHDGLGDYRQLLVSKQYREAESLRASLAVLWGEIQEDIIELGVPRHWGGSGRLFPIFEVALSSFDSLAGSVFFDSIDHARTSLEIAQGRLRRRVRQRTLPDRTAPPVVAERGSEVFLVHGRDMGLREAVARFIERLGLIPIILLEQPSKSQTIIEKLEKYSEVTYAVVLLTPDDIGYAGQSPEPARPRQNVILELGYFMGALGRENVCVLHAGGLELPSDMHGILYIPADSGAWKLRLAQELRSAGFGVDLNKVID